MVDEFWASHMSFAEVGKKLGCSRQNISQEAKRGKIPVDRDADGRPGVPMVWVDETLRMRKRDKNACE
ncbi:MAG TPA: hypothetical protein VMV58_01850 [Desulfosporosinus sp.]|nr:hypothetical protein [Desulfosporosinus sp.]